MRKPTLIAAALILAVVAAVMLILVGGPHPPPAKARPILEIGDAATWIGGNRCPPGITQEACKAVLER